MVTSSFKPTYSVKYYRDGFYRLCKFKRNPIGCSISQKEADADSKGVRKFESSISRAKSTVFQVAFCNDWEYFFTGTLDPRWWDRGNLKRFREALSQWVRDFRKKYKCSFSFCFVPERHKDGSWHVHGLMAGIPSFLLTRFVPGIHPWSLVQGDYWNFGEYAKKFGYCSLGVVRDPVAVAFYITKYITKDLAQTNMQLGEHLYSCSRGLSRAVSFGNVYGWYPELDSLFCSVKCVSDTKFCKSCFVRDKDWAFWCEFCECDAYLDGFVAGTRGPVSDGSQECPEWEEMEQLMFFSIPNPGVHTAG